LGDPLKRILVALDVPSADDARRIVEPLQHSGLPFGVKIGMELACAAGHRFIREMAEEDIYIFDDQKRHDIPNTIGQTAKIQLSFGAQMANCMCGCGPEGIRAFAKACDDLQMTTSIGVTVLTSKSDEECLAEFGRTAIEQVRFYARWAEQNGLDGVVCSPHELPMIKENFDLLAVCPGIRPTWAASNDQKRFTTPAEAVRMGADWQVIGRPITDSRYGTPVNNLSRILDEIAKVT